MKVGQIFRMVGNETTYKIAMEMEGMLYMATSGNLGMKMIPIERLEKWLAMGLWEEVMTFEQ